MAKTSVTDKLSRRLAPVMRQLSDINVKILGTETQLLRITTSIPDLAGDTTETTTSQVIDNCIVKHPWGSDIQLFGSLDDVGDFNITSLDLWDVLPIQIKFPFEGDRDIQPLDIKKGDLLVEILRDEHESKIPFVMEVSRLLGAFSNKYIVSKHCEATLYRGKMPTAIRTEIDAYIDSIE